jgi:hypothetical protein
VPQKVRRSCTGLRCGDAAVRSRARETVWRRRRARVACNGVDLKVALPAGPRGVLKSERVGPDAGSVRHATARLAARRAARATRRA